MGRFVSILLLGVYLLYSAGVVVLIHTCGGSRTFDVMPLTAEDPCGCSDFMSEDACCTLSLRAFQIDDDQNAAPRIAPGPVVEVCAVLPLDLAWAPAHTAVRSLSMTPSPPEEISPTLLGCALLI
jgi:hypothetical protein